jgi:hypothetical protein
MGETGPVPDILAFELAEAVNVLNNNNLTSRIVFTSPHGKPGHGIVRVIRQSTKENGTVELTVSAEDWGKEV